MRQLSVLTTVALTVAVVTSSAFGGALVATDPPDIALMPGTPLTDAFDLNDYFVGGELADGTVDIAGAAAPGITPQTYDITVGADTVTVGNVVKVSTFLVANGPAIDQLANPGANPFVNALRPGQAVSSVSALVGAGAAGAQGTTPGPVTGPAWTITMANVSSGYQDGLRVRSSSLIAGPDGPSLSAGGLTAEIDAAGNYTLTSEAGFGGAVVVTFISEGAGGMDGASVLAAASMPLGADYTANDTPITADGLQILSAVNVSGEVTVSVDCTAAAGVQVALAVLEAPGGAPTGDLAYVNPLASGSMQTLSVTYNSASGTILPAVQAAGGTATFSNLTITNAPAIPDLAIGANAVDLFEAVGLSAGAPLDGNLNSAAISAFAFSPNSAPGAPAISTENNFGAAGQSIALGEADAAAYDNISVVAGASAPGHVKATVWAKGAGHLDLVMIQIGAVGQQTAIGNQGAFSSANWAPVSAAGQLYLDGTLLVVAQGVGGGADSILIDDITVTQVQDLPEYFDAALLGL